MTKEQRSESLLKHAEPGRRDAIRKILAGAAVYSAPIVTSFSIDSLGGTAQAQVPNQTTPTAVPTTTGWGLTSLVAMLAAAGAVITRRWRDR